MQNMVSKAISMSMARMVKMGRMASMDKMEDVVGTGATLNRKMAEMPINFFIYDIFQIETVA